MNENRHGILSQIQSTKIKEMKSPKYKSKSKKVKFSYFPRLKHIMICFGDIFLAIINKITTFISHCSIVIQLPLFLIPISIIMIVSLFIIHINFYNEFYVFNISKTLKEEFHDLYITKIDDFNTELTAINLQENKLDTENQLFFHVYFKELSMGGFINDELEYQFLPKLTEDDFQLFSELNFYKGIDANFTLNPDNARKKFEEKYYNILGEFGKLYYYMFPYMWYESLYTNSFINQSFFLAYEIYFYCDLMGSDLLFFRYPKINEGFANDNFIYGNHLLNPSVEYLYFGHLGKRHDYYFSDNWFSSLDYVFKCLINFDDEDFLVKNTFAHMNYENDGNINKTFIKSSHEYLKIGGGMYGDRYFVISIIHFLNQSDLKEGDIDYTSFLIKDNRTFVKDEENKNDTEEENVYDDYYGAYYDIDENINEKYSDNYTYVLTITDSTEYSMSEIDYALFHLGLYDNESDFFANGVFYDSFNLGYLYDYSDSYIVSKGGENDIKYFITLYLFKSLFQKVNFTKFEKEGEEIFFYHFSGEDEVKEICEKINFSSYRSYLKNSGINCWDKRSQLYYDIDSYKYLKIVNDTNKIDPIYPYCSCLPLYCLKNFKDLDENLNNLEFSNEINLPNKCQNRFTNFDTTDENLEYEENTHNKIIKFMGFTMNKINYDYVKFIFLDLNKLPGYLLFLIVQIRVTGEIYIHTYYKLIIKVEIIIITIASSLLISVISIIIIYKNLKKYSLIIDNFKKKYEFYIFHSLEEKNEINSYGKYNLKKNIGIKKNKKIEDRFEKDKNKKSSEIDSLTKNVFLNINENTLFNDLFLIFSEVYNIERSDIEKFLIQHNQKSRKLVKLNMMNDKNELFELLSSFSLYAPFFQLNLDFDYNMYEYTKIMKKYNAYVKLIENNNKKQVRLTKNVLYELISTECICDYGLVTNLKFSYVTNKKASSNKNSIQYTLFGNIKNKQVKNDNIPNEEDSGKTRIKKLVLKRKNILIDIYKNRFESDDFLNYNKLDSAFNFFLINSYYKYCRQIGLEKNSS